MRNNGYVQLTGTSSVMVELKQEIERIARSDAKVLITGESGVGKELVATRCTRSSPRGRRRSSPSTAPAFLRRCSNRSCSATSRAASPAPTATSPASSSWPTSGTIFLDEIGEMTLRMQGLLLRFLETGELQKVGADAHRRSRRRAGHCRDQPQPARHGRAGHVPRGSVLPAERHSSHRAAAARAPRGHSRAGRVTSSRRFIREQRLHREGAVARSAARC